MERFKSLAILLLFLTAGCTGGAGNENSTSSPKTAEARKPIDHLKVALLTPGPVSDSGWNAMAYQGLTQIKSDLDAEVNNEQASGTMIKDGFRTYAQKGYNLVFGHGFEYNDPAMEVAKDFPNTVFISTSGSKSAANVGVIRFYLEQGFYLAGMMAGLMTKTNKVAMIGGDDVASIKSTFHAFEAGAKAANPKVEVISTFTGSGTDIAKAKQATLAAIASGADFVIHQANNAAQGVFDAAKEKGVYAFGANADQNDNASGAVIASATITGSPAFVAVAKEVKEGTFKGGVELMGMAGGNIDFVVNPKLKDKIPADVMKKVEDAREQIKSGKLDVPKDTF